MNSQLGREGVAPAALPPQAFLTRLHSAPCSGHPHDKPPRQVPRLLPVTDVATAPQSRVRPRPHCEGGEQGLKGVPGAAAIKLLIHMVLSLGLKWGQNQLNPPSTGGPWKLPSPGWRLNPSPPLPLHPWPLPPPRRPSLSHPDCVCHPCPAAMNIQTKEIREPSGRAKPRREQPSGHRRKDTQQVGSLPLSL